MASKDRISGIAAELGRLGGSRRTAAKKIAVLRNLKKANAAKRAAKKAK